MSAADVVLLLANVVYGSSYVATRLVLDDVPPATLAFLRVAVGALVLLPLAARRGMRVPATRGDRWRIAGMGLFGFAGAFILSHWGIARSTATNAALLITIEPLTLVLLGPLLLGERLTRREAVGAALAMTGAMLVVVNGVPGLTEQVAPHWRGDLLLMCAGVAYASYSLLGREVLGRLPSLPVTARSIVWAVPALAPLAALEWWDGRRPVWSASAIVGTLYLAIVITALAYLAWNWGLERVTAPRAAIFLNVQPVVGVSLGMLVMGDPASPFTAAGGVLVLVGLYATVRPAGP